MTIYFSADKHLGHKAIIGHCNRKNWTEQVKNKKTGLMQPHYKMEKMTLDLIKNENSLVDQGDTLYELGDWCWFGPERRAYHENMMSKLNGGVNRHLILGNHDRLNPFTYVDIGWTTVHTAFWTNLNGIDFVMCHDPSEYDVVKEKSVLLCGHVHGLFGKHLLPQSRVINVGVDVWDFKPVSLEQIIGLLTEYKMI
jgi:calcineurin-like phosphoesterase family protein